MFFLLSKITPFEQIVVFNYNYKSIFGYHIFILFTKKCTLNTCPKFRGHYSTLQLLCKASHTNIVHNNQDIKMPVHSPMREHGVQAYVILSTGKEASQRTSKRGRKIPQRFHKLENIRKKFKIRVYPKTDQFSVRGVDSFFKD